MKLGRWLNYVVLGTAPPPHHRKKRRGWPVDDWRYRRFIRNKACIACGTIWCVEFAHTGAHGLSTKAPDCDGLPICAEDHRTGQNALHKIGPAQFQQLHGLKFGSLIREFHLEWLELNHRRRT